MGEICVVLVILAWIWQPILSLSLVLSLSKWRNPGRATTGNFGVRLV